MLLMMQHVDALVEMRDQRREVGLRFQDEIEIEEVRQCGHGFTQMTARQGRRVFRC